MGSSRPKQAGWVGSVSLAICVLLVSVRGTGNTYQYIYLSIYMYHVCVYIYISPYLCVEWSRLPVARPPSSPLVDRLLPLPLTSTPSPTPNYTRPHTQRAHTHKERAQRQWNETQASQREQKGPSHSTSPHRHSIQPSLLCSTNIYRAQGPPRLCVCRTPII